MKLFTVGTTSPKPWKLREHRKRFGDRSRTEMRLGSVFTSSSGSIACTAAASSPTTTHWWSEPLLFPTVKGLLALHPSWKQPKIRFSQLKELRRKQASSVVIFFDIIHLSLRILFVWSCWATSDFHYFSIHVIISCEAGFQTWLFTTHEFQSTAFSQFCSKPMFVHLSKRCLSYLGLFIKCDPRPSDFCKIVNFYILLGFVLLY